MGQEMQFLKNRFIDLSKRADERCFVTFSNFLDMNELNIFRQTAKELYSSFELSGGYEYAERQMIAFIPDALSSCAGEGMGNGSLWEFPIAAIQITPAHPKYAERLTHPDVLGALMNLGIKREMLGDILIKDNEIIVLCVDTISAYLVENCHKIRHTQVKLTSIPVGDFQFTPKKVTKEGLVTSFRLDTIIADVWKLTRSNAQKIIFEGNAFVNSQKISKNDYYCQNKDVISVRHYGKFELETTDITSKKGKIKCRYNIYS